VPIGELDDEGTRVPDPAGPADERATWGACWCLALVCLVLLVGLLLSGCALPGTVRTEEVRPLAELIVERHQRYVTADPALTPDQRRLYLRSGEILREVLRAQ